MGLSYKTQHLTKTHVTLLFCGVVILCFILIWLLLGDMNLLHLQWLIPYHGKEWSGKVTLENYDNLFGTYQSEIKYWASHPTDSHIPETKIVSSDGFLNYANQWFPDGMTILSISAKFNSLILIPIIVLVVLSATIPLVLRIFRIMEIDIYIFIIPIVFSSVVFIFCGFIPSVNNNGWLLILRVVIFLVILIITFFISNKIINTVIGNSSLVEQAIIDIASQERERNQAQQTLRELKEEYRKQDDVTYVDIGKDD